MVTDRIEDSVTPQCRSQLFDEQRQQNAADNGQVEIVDHEQPVQFERLSFLHELPADEDRDVVGDEHRYRGL